MAVADKLNELRIKANLLAGNTTGLMDIRVEVDDGVAILDGEVENEEQKKAAEELAYEVEGIHEVANNIRVTPSHEGETAEAHMGYSLAEGDASDMAFAIGGQSTGPAASEPTTEQFPGEFDDAEIEEEIRRKLASQDLLDASNVKVRSINQIAHLQGSVKTAEDLYNLHDLVLNLRGVMGINSDVAIGE